MGPGGEESGLEPGKVLPLPAPGSSRLCLWAQANVSEATLTGSMRPRCN